MKKWTQLLLVALIIGCGILYARHMINNKPVAEKRPSTPALATVELQVAKPTSFTIYLSTRGSVSAKTQGELVAQVSGQITAVNPNLREGQLFAEGAVLAEVDSRDYQAAVAIAEADVATAKQTMAEEQALAAQAARDWKRLNLNQPASDLTLRKPQLAGAEASVKAAEARLTQARLDLERTQIRAPYDGIIREQLVDLGQYLSPGKAVANIFSQGAVEIRLPLTSLQYRRLDDAPNPPVTVTVEGDVQPISWHGKIVRRAGALDVDSRQLFVIAEVKPTTHTLPVGQYVNASIQGKTLHNVVVIPRTALYENSYVWLANDDNTLRRADVTIAWKTTDSIIVSDGIQAGDKVVTTNLPFASNGTEVNLAGDQPKQQQNDDRRRDKPKREGARRQDTQRTPSGRAL